MTSNKPARPRLIGLTPLYAAVGATEIAAEKLRELGSQAEAQARAERARRASAASGTQPAPPTEPTTATADEEPAPGSLRDLGRLARGARLAPSYAAEQLAQQLARTQEVYRETASRAQEAYRDTTARAQDAYQERLNRTQETYEDLAGRGRRLTERGDAFAPAPVSALRQAADEVSRRRHEAEEAARAAVEAARSAAAAATAVFGRRDAATETIVMTVGEGRRRSLRDAATDLEQDERRSAQGRGRRRSSAAARTAAPGPTRPVVESEVVVRTPVPAGSGVEAASTVTPATGTPAAPRVAGTRRRIRVADAVDGAAFDSASSPAAPTSAPTTSDAAEPGTD